jgi:hypothetical protein
MCQLLFHHLCPSSPIIVGHKNLIFWLVKYVLFGHQWKYAGIQPLLVFINANRKIRKRTDTDVAFTREYSRVSISTGNVKCTKKSLERPTKSLMMLGREIVSKVSNRSKNLRYFWVYLYWDIKTLATERDVKGARKLQLRSYKHQSERGGIRWSSGLSPPRATTNYPWDWVQFQVTTRLSTTPNLKITTLALQRLEHLMQAGI